MDDKKKNIFIGIAGALLITAAFLGGRWTGGGNMAGKISDALRDVERITAEMEAAVPVLVKSVDTLGSNTEKLDGITGTIEQFTDDLIGRIGNIESTLDGKLEKLDGSIERSIELNKQSTERLEAALGAGNEMDEYIDRITDYIDGVAESTESGNH